MELKDFRFSIHKKNFFPIGITSYINTVVNKSSLKIDIKNILRKGRKYPNHKTLHVLNLEKEKYLNYKNIEKNI